MVQGDRIRQIRGNPNDAKSMDRTNGGGFGSRVMVRKRMVHSRAKTGQKTIYHTGFNGGFRTVVFMIPAMDYCISHFLQPL